MKIKNVLLVVLICAVSIAMTGCGKKSDKNSVLEYKVSYNLNTHFDDMPNFQFMKGNNTLIAYDGRVFQDITLSLASNGTYRLVSDSYTFDGENRYVPGDDSGIGQVIMTEAEGIYTDNGNGSVTISKPTLINYTIETDTYSTQIVEVLGLSYNENKDGNWTLESNPEIIEMVPETTFVLTEDGNIVTYTRVDNEAATKIKAEIKSESTENNSSDVLLLTITSDDAATELLLKNNGKYEFKFEAYSISDIGTYSYDSDRKILTLTDEKGIESSSIQDEDSIKIKYTYSQSDQLTGSFTTTFNNLEVIK